MKKPKINFTNLAWEFLRRNPGYQVEWQEKFEFLPNPQIKDNSLQIPLITQNHSDLLAKKWGLPTYQDPSTPHHVMSPFWNTAPMIEAEIIPNSERPLLPHLRKLSMSISGLFLLNDNLILKIENYITTLQILIKNGHLFNENSSLSLNVTFDDQISQRVSPALNFWNHASCKAAKKEIFTLPHNMMNCSIFSTFIIAGNLIAR